jgi:hypothetical protein
MGRLREMTGSEGGGGVAPVESEEGIGPLAMAFAYVAMISCKNKK